MKYCAEHKDQRKDAFLAAITTDCPYCRIAELEQQLSRYQSKYNNLLAVAHRDGGHYLAQHGEEKAGEAAITAILAAYHSNDRYQGAVEVEGYVARSGLLELDDILPATLDSQRVRVLVKEVE